MTELPALYRQITHWLDHIIAPLILPLLARLVFAATLVSYFWTSALTKLGEGAAGLFQPSFSAYTQILPRVFDAVGYDPSQIGLIGRAVVLGGTWAEFILPALIVIGLATRLAALGMIGFILVQSWVDIMGHGVAGDDIGAWFDKNPASLILDQRAFWIFILLVLVAKGAGALSLDAWLRHKSADFTAADQPK